MTQSLKPDMIRVTRMVGRVGKSNNPGKPADNILILGGREELIDVGQQRMVQSRLEMRDKKLAYLDSTNTRLNYLASSPDLEILSKRIVEEMALLFDPKGDKGISMVLLQNQGAIYRPLIQIGPTFDLAKLDPSGKRSLVRSAGEVEPLNRGILYIPDTSRQDYYLATKQQIYNREARGIEARQHQLYMGELPKGLRNEIDRASLRAAPALVACPILEISYKKPVGSLVLAGPKDFLDAEVDLIPLRTLADQIAATLQKLS
jgi:hypothetical protein